MVGASYLCAATLAFGMKQVMSYTNITLKYYSYSSMVAGHIAPVNFTTKHNSLRFPNLIKWLKLNNEKPTKIYKFQKKESKGRSWPYRVKKVLTYTKIIVGMWRSTHVFINLVKNISFGQKQPRKTIWLRKLTI